MKRPRQSVRVTVSTEKIDPAALTVEVGRPDAGATVLFLGTVRDHSEGKQGVTHLDYEVYPEMVEPKIREVVDEALSRWPILDVVVQHRSGVVQLEEASVAVAVSASHRAEAFAAAEFIIDRLKQHAPIWKKEHWPGGAEWSKGS